MKKYYIVGIAGIVLIAGFLWFSYKGVELPNIIENMAEPAVSEQTSPPITQPSASQTKPSVTTPPKLSVREGRVLFLVTDAGAALDNIESVLLNVKEAYVHSVTKGWVAVSQKPRQFNLLQLYRTGAQELLADIPLEDGIYNQARFVIDSVFVTEQGKVLGAKLPSNDLRINTNLVVRKGETSATVFDFILKDALHKTGSGQYILFPIIKLETQSNVDNIQQLKGSNNVELFGGNIDSSTTQGMNEKGVLQNNFSFSPYAIFDIVGNEIQIVK